MATPGPAVGELIGAYRVLRKLGEGGMGVVYLAEDIRLGRQVALKTLAREYADDPERRKRFLNEARAVAALNHAGVAAVYELEERGDQVCIIFEYVEGMTLRSLLQRQGSLPLQDLLEIATQVAGALEAAHAKGIVHRDLKPENVMRRPGGDVKVLDFGLARMDSGVLGGISSTTQSYGLTKAGTVMGTVGYMSPEQLEGKPTDFRSDIFAFGVLLYELATGTHPFAGETPASTIANVLTHEPPPLTAANALHPGELDRIVKKCLRKSRDDRYQSTRELLVDLKNLKADSGPSPVRTAPPALRRKARTLALLQGTFALVYAGLAIAVSRLMADAVAGKLTGMPHQREAVVGTAVTVMAGFFACAASTAGFVSRPQEAARQFVRFFPVFAGLNILAGVSAGSFSVPLLSSFLLMFLLPIAAVWATFFERTLARELAPPEPEGARQDRRPLLLFAIHAFFAALFGSLSVVMTDILRRMFTEPGWAVHAQVIAIIRSSLAVSGLLLSVGFAVQSLRSPETSARSFVRFFPAFAFLYIFGGVIGGVASAVLLDSYLLAIVLPIVGLALGTYARLLARQLAPPAPRRRSDFSFRRPQTWWVAHQLANILVLAPWVGYWGSLTRGYYPPFGKTAFFLLLLLLGARWALHFVVLCVWIANHAALPATWQRLSLALRYVGFAIVAVMLVEASMAAANDALIFGGLLGALAIGGLVSVVYIEPLLIPPGGRTDNHYSEEVGP